MGYFEQNMHELSARLVRLERNGMENRESLIDILSSYPANLKCFEDEKIFRLVYRICLTVYHLDSAQLASAVGAASPNVPHQWAAGRKLPHPLARPPHLQGLMLRFKDLTGLTPAPAAA